jgi:lysophospholipase L1-like esterase
MRSLRSWPNLLRNVGVSVVSAIVALLAIEGVLRILTPLENMPIAEHDSLLGWRGRANLECVIKEHACRFSVIQNAQGFRDRERSPRRTEDGIRILCVGDSFTWGWGVEQEETYTRILEDRLLSEGHRAEVINAGVCGYSTDQVLLFLQNQGFDYSPDLIVCQATSNDVLANTRDVSAEMYDKPRFELDESGTLSPPEHPVPSPRLVRQLESGMFRHSQLARLVKHRLARLRPGPAIAQSSTWGLTKDEDGADEPLRLFRALINRMDQECGARGIRLAVLLDFPLRPDQMDYWHRHCGSVETHFLASYLRGLEERHGTPAAIPGDGHWTAQGHQWVADYLHDHVLLSIPPPL